MITVTKRFIERGMTGSGGWTRRQLEILGESWPPSSGWKDRASGREITEERAHEFLAIREYRTARLEKKYGREPVNMPSREQVKRVMSAAIRGATIQDTAAIAQVQQYFDGIYGEE